MAASSCDLTKYGYDFVVATTQGSIDADMKAYLGDCTFPDNYFCFLADAENADAVVPISLQDLLTKTGGINPFEIPNGTPTTDPRIQALTKARFEVGIRMNMGLPEDIPPKSLPPIIQLGDSPTTVSFNVIWSKARIIQNTVPSEWSLTGNWSVWDQPAQQAWTFSTSINLVPAAIDNQLNGSAHFSQNPVHKQKILNQLQNLSGTAFSLQQLLLDFENAKVLTPPTIEGMTPGSRAQCVLSGQLAGFWSLFSKQCTYPPLAVFAKQTVTDTALMQLTSISQQVNPCKDSNGALIVSPTKEQTAASTLDYLCMTNNKQIPREDAFTWSWVQPSDVQSQSGVLAIRRDVFSQFLLDVVWNQVKANCITTMPNAGQIVVGNDSKWPPSSPVTLCPNQTPQSSWFGPGSTLFTIQYTAANDTGTTATNWDWWNSSSCSLRVIPTYQCIVSQINGQIVVEQTLSVSVTFDYVNATYITQFANWSNTWSFVPFSVTRTDTYQVSVGQAGQLQIVYIPGSQVHNSFHDWDKTWYTEQFLDSLGSNITGMFYNSLTALNFSSSYLNNLQNSIFPGAKVFAYSSVSFSENSDLLCGLTYLDPEEAIPSDAPSQTQATDVTYTTQPSSTPTPSPLTSCANSPVTMTYSSDMIQNYVVGEIFNSTGKFEALQTADGHSILFGLSSSNMLQAIVEQSGATSTGWQLMDIMSTALASIFANDTSAIVKTFDVNQSAVNGTISMAAVVTSGASDHLLLSLNNDNSATSWTTTTSLTWTVVPFDAVPDGGTTIKNITITGVMFTETTYNGKEHIIVDIDRSSTSCIKDIARYYVKPSASPCWTKHDVPVDIQEGNYQSCVGRFSKGYGIDAVFTSGLSGGSAQLVYVPFDNPYSDDATPLVRTLTLPGGVLATAISTARHVDGTTDLFAIGGSTLYMFPANSLASETVATRLTSSIFFEGTDQLIAMTNGQVTTIWGRNTNNEVYYVTCSNTQLGIAASWSTPLPLLTNIDQISAYINRSLGGNTIFATGGETIKKLVQATEGAKLWREQDILLEPQLTAQPHSFNSYTTTLQVINGQSLPAVGQELSITTPSQTAVYINGVYYVLSPTPRTVITDKTGVVTIAEPADNSINGTTLTVVCDGISTTIDPTQKHFQTIASLGTAGSLQAATIQTNVIAGGTIGTSTTAPLVDSSASSDDLSDAASYISNLNSVYGKVNSPSGNASPSANPTSSAAPVATPAPTPMMELESKSIFSDILSSIEAVAGDIYHALKSAVNSVVQVIKQAASGAWYFIATIAGQAYHAILDTAEAVVGAVEWVFSAIKTGVKDVIRFLEVLLDWDDIKRTKQVIYNTTQLWFQHQIDQLPQARTLLNTQIANLENKIDNWAGDVTWTSQLGQAAQQPLSANTNNPTATSGSQVFTNHYKNNASGLTVVGTPPAEDAVQQLFDDLVTALENEGQILDDASRNIVALAKRIASQPFEDTLKQLAAIVADIFLSSFENIGDAIIDILTSLTNTAMDVLNTKIHIPVISDILEKIGIQEISFLDLFCWIPAVAYTVMYKIANNSDAPFPDSSDVNSLINAQTWEDFQALLAIEAVPVQTEPSSQTLEFSVVQQVSSLSPEFRRGLYKRFHAAGALVKTLWTLVSVLEVEAPADPNPYGKSKTVLNIVHAALGGIAGFAVPQDPVTDKSVRDSDYAQLAVSVLASGILYMIKKISGPSAQSDLRVTGAMVGYVVGIWGLADSICHLCQISSETADSCKTAAFLIETNNILGFVGVTAYYVALGDPDPVTKEETVVAMGVIGLLQAGLEASLDATV
ncbi:hypothetical protein FMEXI_5017 [Fusarium mexicanum]|uniref:Uncharacterized protein n=1 Tax=Fusarium mexicanum TaxID=751941 RepID=A0A8H5J3Q6_9HYPO|nr:hypothetical protein FMEXI_5017 [Fusarium mexicanum]